MRVNRVSDEKKQRALNLAQDGSWRQWTVREAMLATYLRDLLDRPDWRAAQQGDGAKD